MNNRKILLALLPFWTPLIPPQGLSRLKGFLQQHGYHVTTIDVNLENKFKQLYDKYFQILRKYIPEDKLGNLYNIGNDVWRDHMMAHIHHNDEKKYMELVKIIINKVFFFDMDDEHITELIQVLDDFYRDLEDYFVPLLEKEKPDVLGLSVYRDTLPASLYIFRLAKKKYPHLLTVMGGSIFTIQLTLDSPNMEFFLEQTRDYLDKIIVGEGERIFLKLLQGHLDDSIRLYSTEDIGGDTIGFAPLDQFDFSDFSPENYHYMAAQGSGSCPFKCSFCNVHGFYGNYRKKDPARTVDEMLQLYEKYRCQVFFMLDSLLNDVADGISKELIRRDISMYWDGYFRIPKVCTKEMAYLWRRGGFYRARIGVESGSQKVLDLMGKGINIGQIKNCITNLAEAGIKTTAYIVIGHPGETEADFQMTLDLLSDLRSYLWEAECNPFTYFYSGQGHGDAWAEKRTLLYPEWAKEMLISQTWIVNDIPSREEMYDRVCRFVDHCKQLGISVPWTPDGVKRSDERWHRLHKNAVPSLFKLINKEIYIDDTKHVKQVMSATFVEEEDDDFDF